MAEPLSPSASVAEILDQYRARPVRVSLFDAVYHDRLGRFPGLLADVLADSLWIDCLEIPPSVPPDTYVTLELVRNHEIFWCHTHVLPGMEDQPYRLRLAWPQRLQTSQQRNWPRVDTYVPIHYIAGDREIPLNGVLVNISVGGIALQSAHRLEQGQVVSLVFALGSGLYFQDIRAEVLRATATRGGGWFAGLRFVALSEEQERHLTEWVTRRSADV